MVLWCAAFPLILLDACRRLSISTSKAGCLWLPAIWLARLRCLPATPPGTWACPMAQLVSVSPLTPLTLPFPIDPCQPSALLPIPLHWVTAHTKLGIGWTYIATEYALLLVAISIGRC